MNAMRCANQTVREVACLAGGRFGARPKDSRWPQWSGTRCQGSPSVSAQSTVEDPSQMKRFYSPASFPCARESETWNI
jgi:hypothetical protein